MVEIKKVLYATDLSDLSAWALQYAVSLAVQYRAELHCINVVDDSYQYWLTFDAAALPAGPAMEDLMPAAEKQLDDFLNGQVPPDVPLTKRLLRGRPFIEIIRYARENAIDVLVVGTHGWGALRQVLMGSVADRVVRKSPCPVLAVRHPEHGFEMP
jgi:nucleotide-binding universal stress UspA family protein